MERITKWISNNPVLVIGMSLLGIISGIVTVATSWSAFSSILLSDVKLPGWLIILVLCLFFGVLCYLAGNRTSPIEEEALELELIEGKEFGVQRITLDGKRFINCKFDGTEFVIEGRLGFGLEHNKLSGIRITMSGASATTLNILEMLHKDPSFRPFVEHTFKNIANGTIPRSIG